jgi:hypothetical protein
MFVAVYLTISAIIFVYLIARSVEKWDMGRLDFGYVVNDAIREVGFILGAVLLWRYSASLKRFNRDGSESAAANLESAHAALWRCVAALFLVYAVSVSMLITRPPIQLPTRDEPPPTQNESAPK